MKKRYLLPILALVSSMLLAGCQNKKPTPSESTPESVSETTEETEESTPAETESGEESETESTQQDVYTAEITNKEVLTAKWTVGDANRVMVVSITKNGVAQNAVVAIGSGELTVSSSDPEVVSNSGLTLLAGTKAGKATITVSYHGETDTVSIELGEKESAKTKYGTAHAGTLEDPLDNTDALKVGEWCKENGNTPDELYVGGEIARFYHAPGSRGDGAVSWFLKELVEGEGQFEVYKCYKDDGTALTDDDVWVNGYAVAHGIFTYYADGHQAETTGATLDSCEGNKPQPRKTIETDLATALEVGAALVDGADSYDYYKFDAYVTEQSGKNYFLTATKGEALVSATSDADHGSKSYYSNAFEIYNASADLEALLLKNAKVTVTSIIKNYHGQVENLLALTVNDVAVLEAGQPWIIPEHDVTVAQALEVVRGLDDSATTTDLYNIKAYVIAITGAYSTKYGNMSFTIADTADGTDTLTVFRALTDETTAAKVVAGAKVSLQGNLQKYVKDGVTTPELLNVKSITVEDGEGGGGGDSGEQLSGTITVLPSDFTAVSTAGAINQTVKGIKFEISNGIINDSQVRVYKNQTLKISAKGMQKIVFTCTANGTAQYGPGCFAELAGYTYETDGPTGTWEGTADTLTFTASSNQVRITKMVFTFPGEGGEEPPVAEEPEAVKATMAEVWASEAEIGTVKFHVEKVELHSFCDNKAVATETASEYGNALLGENGEYFAYGLTASATALTWNADSAKFVFKNPKDFLTNEVTKNLVAPVMVDLDLIRADYKGTKEVTGVITKVYEAETPVEQPLPLGVFTGHAEATVAGSPYSAYCAVAFGETLAYVEVENVAKVTTTYSYVKETGVFTVALIDGTNNYGTLTGTYDAESHALVNVGIDGDMAAMITNNNEITLTGATHLWNCDGTTAELQATFKRRYMSGSWQVDESHEDRFVSVADGISGSAMQRRGWTGGAVALNLNEFFAEPIEVSNIGFWVYNPSENDVTLRQWIYKSASFDEPRAEIGNVTAKAGGWTYCRMGFTKVGIYNIQIADFTNSGVNLIFDDIAIY